MSLSAYCLYTILIGSSLMKSIRICIMTCLVVILFIPFIAISYIYYASYEKLVSTIAYRPSIATKIYDTNGDLISEVFDQNRSITNINEIPERVKNAFLAAEDRDFYSHKGFDVSGILRALIVNISKGDIKQGGSTITQQLVKQIYSKGEKTMYRKIMEIFISIQLENNYSKNQILQMYLNNIYFGSGVYGIQSASRFFFNKNVNELSILEASFLSVIPSSPATYSPFTNPRAVYEKHKKVIRNLIVMSKITKNEIDESFPKFWEKFLYENKDRYPTIGVRNISLDKAPYFSEYIRQMLITQYGEDEVYKGGLEVHTTLDLRYQQMGERLLAQAIHEQNRLAEKFNTKRVEAIDAYLIRRVLKKRLTNSEVSEQIRFRQRIREDIVDEVLGLSLLTGADAISNGIESSETHFTSLVNESRVEGAMISLRPSDGAILTMIGGSEFNSNNQLNRATQMRRQPGSAFKTFVYCAGIELKKITAASCYTDAPILFKGRHKTWKPSNYDRSFEGKVLVRKAFAHSLNVVSALIIDDIGTKEVGTFAAKILGIPYQRFAIDPTLSLGTSELSPLEMAKGFAVIANTGFDITPYAITQIKKTTKTLYRHNAAIPRKRILSAQAAYIMTSLMKDVVDSGTATSGIRNSAGYYLPGAGKTGTNTNFRDAWFVGFTSDIATSIWMGCDSQKYSLAWGQSASSAVTPIWGSFMREIYSTRKMTPFPSAPTGIEYCTICRHTGLLSKEGCTSKSEIFITGTKPEAVCDGDHEEMTSVFELMKKRKKQLEDQAMVK